MNSMDSLGSLQRPLKDELAEAITTVCGGKGAGAMAEDLLRRDKQSHQLVGVIEAGEKAVFYEPGRWGVVAVPLYELGVDSLGRSQMNRLSASSTGAGLPLRHNATRRADSIPKPSLDLP
jgi:hypothetical protein